MLIYMMQFVALVVKGKRSGSLHEVKPISLLTQLFDALKTRNHLPTQLVDDVVHRVV